MNVLGDCPQIRQDGQLRGAKTLADGNATEDFSGAGWPQRLLFWNTSRPESKEGMTSSCFAIGGGGKEDIFVYGYVVAMDRILHCLIYKWAKTG